MNVTQCDNCKKLGPCPAPGWIVAVIVPQPQSSWLTTVLGGGAPGDMEGIFCTWRCLAEYAAARALIPGGEAAR